MCYIEAGKYQECVEILKEDIDNNEMVTNCSIPINEILDGELTFQYSVYYSGKYYNTYSKKVSFVKKYEYIFLKFNSN